MIKARDNPFRTERVLRVRYRLRDETMDDLLDRLKSLNYRAAIVGPKGTGKTTLLEDLGVSLSALGFGIKHLWLKASREGSAGERRHHYLPTPLKRPFTQRSFPRAFLKQFFTELTEGDVILLDGAEQMSRLEWHSFKLRSKQAAGLVVTSHNPGMLPTLKACDTTPELLADILGELLDAESAELCDASGEMHRRHHGNLRNALREMYDLYAGNPAQK